jgi:hypothetical protein
MKPVTSASLDGEQKNFLAQLNAAGQQIKQANEVLAKGTEPAVGSARATALLLSAIARIYLLETAEKYNMRNRLSSL